MGKLRVAMAVMAAVMALSVSAVAFAQTPTPPTSPTPQSPLSAYNQTFWQTLADQLGTSVGKVQQAVRDALKAVVAQALKNGKLTQSQADAANSRIDQQQFNKPPFGPFLGPRGFGMGHGEFAAGAEINAAATKLGMTVQDLMTELRSGKTLADVAKEKNVSADDLKAAIITAITAQIDQAVTNGKLTQAQADQLKSNLNSQIDLNQSWPNGGEFKGFGRGRGFGFGRPQQTTPQLGTPQ
jgi:polyhydroxyalkanoate synthesis regulator phasin